MTAEPTTEDVHWPVPPEQGYTVDDLFTLPNLPPHTELIDGSLIFAAAQTRFHTQMMFLLETQLRRAVPDGLAVVREMVVVLTRRTAPEPDIAVVRSQALTGPEQTRFEKSERYVPAGTFVNRLTTDRPFPVDIDLTEVDRL